MILHWSRNCSKYFFVKKKKENENTINNIFYLVRNHDFYFNNEYDCVDNYVSVYDCFFSYIIFNSTDASRCTRIILSTIKYIVDINFHRITWHILVNLIDLCLTTIIKIVGKRLVLYILLSDHGRQSDV